MTKTAAARLTISLKDRLTDFGREMRRARTELLGREFFGKPLSPFGRLKRLSLITLGQHLSYENIVKDYLGNVPLPQG